MSWVHGVGERFGFVPAALGLIGLLFLVAWLLPRLLGKSELMRQSRRRQRALNRASRLSQIQPWLWTYAKERKKRRDRSPNEEVHVLLCLADHYEPRQWDPPENIARGRVERWNREYPRLFGQIRDSDGRPPQHTFFYPLDQYETYFLEPLADLCHRGFGEVEVHYHHENDTAENLRRQLIDFKELLASRHKLLSRDQRGQIAFGFIHGDWALDNSHPDGLACGVNNELDVLREAGCYADFTYPSAPDPTQVRKINSLYYAVDDPKFPKSHDWGTDVGLIRRPGKSLMIVEGPLLLDWSRKKWGFAPRVENASLHPAAPPSLDRLKLWMRARVGVVHRPDWIFVKLHTHGALEPCMDQLLGPQMLNFHRGLMDLAKADPRFHFHYVTAREMYNLARAAEYQWKGSVVDAKDFELRKIAQTQLQVVSTGSGS